ncbi:MAG: PQQ-binding-like beta-propeller repeat protein [Candidatus Schekmanbacteria bacterium]|nr:PQQ-binding-like beta-propeller repeat protein [Candidatus Schekmanbacteria bacterium]
MSVKGPILWCTVMILAITAAPGSGPGKAEAAATPDPWPMFHKDASHTGVAAGSGTIDPAAGPEVRWTYRITPAPAEHDFVTYRWYSSFPLGDLDGDGTLEVVVTTPDNTSEPARIIALKDVAGSPASAQALWTYELPGGHDAAGVDQYSAALVDADGDGLLDVLFCAKDGWVRALDGQTGAVVWEYQTNHFIEAGPMIADLEGDGSQEVVVVTDCVLGPGCPGATGSGALFVFAARAPEPGRADNAPLWFEDFAYKLDSAEPAIVDLDHADGTARKAIVMGTWGGKLEVVWRDAGGQTVRNAIELTELDPAIPPEAQHVIRSSPLVATIGGGPVAVFGWMPDWTVGTEARISAVGLSADMAAGTVTFAPKWTLSRDDWKSSPALLPVDPENPLVVTGYGIGTTSGTGNYGQCDPPTGGIIAVDQHGSVAWENPYVDEGNVRGSPAVGDIDGDGELEVVLTVGCYGKIYAYDGATGALEWGYQLGPRTIGTPSLGDLDGDGSLEIVVPSYDGNVWVLGGSQPAVPVSGVAAGAVMLMAAVCLAARLPRSRKLAASREPI